LKTKEKIEERKERKKEKKERKKERRRKKRKLPSGFSSPGALYHHNVSPIKTIQTVFHFFNKSPERFCRNSVFQKYRKKSIFQCFLPFSPSFSYFFNWRESSRSQVQIHK
jgi:hypothetical protein